jgi:hypothetical protein
VRNLLALIGLVVVLFVVVGYARGWYTFTVSTGTDGKTNVNVSVDGKQLGGDLSAAKAKTSEFIDNIKSKEGTASGTTAPVASLPGPMPVSAK